MKGKNQFLELRAENHPDRQSVVGCHPEGSYWDWFGLKPLFLTVFGKSSKRQSLRVRAENHPDRQSVGFSTRGFI